MSQKGSKTNSFPILLILLGVGFILASLVGLYIMNNPATAEVTPISKDSSAIAKRISLAEAKTAFDQKKAVFLDVRGSAAFAEGHIPGARLIPVTEIETRWNELNKNDWIITYCT